MGIGMRELVVILLVALLVFGTKKLKTIGQDLGGAIRGFKKAMEEGEQEKPEPEVAEQRKPEQIGTEAARTAEAAAAPDAPKKETVS